MSGREQQRQSLQLPRLHSQEPPLPAMLPGETNFGQQLPDKRGRPVVSLELPGKAWTIEGRLLLSNLRLVFQPDFANDEKPFPVVFNGDSADCLSVFLFGVDHLVVTQGNRKVKLRSIDGDSLGGGRVDKLELVSRDFGRCRFLFDARKRRSLLERVSGARGSDRRQSGVSATDAEAPAAQQATELACAFVNNLRFLAFTSGSSDLDAPFEARARDYAACWRRAVVLKAMVPANPQQLRDLEHQFGLGCYPRVCCRRPATQSPAVSALVRSSKLTMTSEFHVDEDVLRDAHGEHGDLLFLFDVDDEMPKLREVHEARRRLLAHCVKFAVQDDLLCPAHSSPTRSFLGGLNDTGWTQLTLACLQTAAALAERVAASGQLVWLREAGDSDWNCLLAGLARLLLVPEERTIAGFQRLVGEEWVTRYPFRDRIGHGTEDSCGCALFALFLDCVWQLTRRCPEAFEFTSVFLTLLHDVAQWPVFQETAAETPAEAVGSPTHSPKQPQQQKQKQRGSMLSFDDYVVEGVRRMFRSRLYNGRPDAEASERLRLPWYAAQLEFWAENYARSSRFSGSQRMAPSILTQDCLRRVIQSDTSVVASPTRQACFYGNGNDAAHFGAPFNWAAADIVNQLLRAQLKDTAATAQLNPAELKNFTQTQL